MMTPKERWLAAMQFQPVDRLPFYPKVKPYYASAQTDPFPAMDMDALHRWIGSDKHPTIPACTKEVRKRTSLEVHTGANVRRTVFNTPVGSTEFVEKSDVPLQWHPSKHPVENLEDIKVMTVFFSDCTAELDEEALEEARAQQARIGSSAATRSVIGTSAMMYWVEYLAGVENGHYLLADHQQAVEALFEAIHQLLLRKTEIMCESHPADCLYFEENTSTTLISPQQYRQFCFGHIEEYGGVAEDSGRMLVLHMCGHLKALLPDLSRLPAAGFEAFTSPPLGNTRFVDGRATCPDTCLIGGTNAVLWTRTANEIIAEIEEDLDALPHHRGLIVSSAGEMTPLCTPETIRAVCDWVKAYEVRG